MSDIHGSMFYASSSPPPLRDITNLSNENLPSTPTNTTIDNMAPKNTKSGTPAAKQAQPPPSTVKKPQTKRTAKDNIGQIQEPHDQAPPLTIKKTQPKRIATKNNELDQDDVPTNAPSTVKKVQFTDATVAAKNNEELQGNESLKEAPTQPPSSIIKKTQPRGKKRNLSEDGDELAQDPVFSNKRARKSMPSASTASALKPATNLRSSSKAPISSPTPPPAAISTTNNTTTNIQLLIPTPAPKNTSLPPPPGAKKPPFCCANSLPTDPSALYTCPNSTCLQRSAILLLQRELKTFDHAIPHASINSLENKRYMIQITKFIPSAADQIALLSTCRTKAAVVIDAEKSQWEIDTSAGVNGRFFVVAERVDGAMGLGDGSSIWEEVESVEIVKWEIVEESKLEFRCDEHQDEKWVCVYWKARK